MNRIYIDRDWKFEDDFSDEMVMTSYDESSMSDVQIHWFSIINSVVVVFFLSGESCGLEGGENKGLRCHMAHRGLLGCSWSPV